jgi:hypothetical protein
MKAAVVPSVRFRHLRQAPLERCLSGLGRGRQRENDRGAHPDSRRDVLI